MKIVVAGAGYAGTVAANRLARKVADAQITVVNPSTEFVERVRLHELIAGSGTATQPLRDVLDDRIELRITAIEKVGDGVLTLSNGESLEYDKLVYAVGSSNDAPEGAYAVGGLETARAAKAKLADLTPGSTVTVVGGGLTGLEAASEVATERPDLTVRIVGDEFGASLSSSARERVLDVLRDLGVDIVTGMWTPDEFTDLTLWAVAGQADTLAARSGLATDSAGRVAVDSCLRSTSNPNVYAIGDSASVPGARLSCQAALPQGAAAADNLACNLAGQAEKPFSMSFVGQNVSLGRKNAVIQSAHRNDVPTRIWFGGRPGAYLKEAVCRGAFWSARTGNALWVRGPK